MTSAGARACTEGRAIAVLVVLMVLAPAGMAAGQPSERPSTPVVRIPFPKDDGSLTPYTFELGYDLMTLVYDTLLVRGPDGLPKPWLAESVETSPDARTLTLRIANGAHWQDGTPLTSADVAFTIGYVANHQHPRFTPSLEPVEAVDTPDPHTAVIRLRRAAPGFTDQPLADMPILPAHLWGGLPPDAVAPEGLPIGSGPYRLVENRPEEGYRFEANNDYFRGRPAVDRIEVVIIRDANATFRAFEIGQVDMVPVTLSEETAERLQQIGTRVVSAPSYLGLALLLNARQPPFDNLEARRAVSQALDLSRMHSLLGDGAAADRGLLHPDSPWASPEVLHVFDGTRASSELARLGVRDVAVLVPDNDPMKEEAGRQVSLALERVGVAAELTKVSQAELSAAIGEDGSLPTFTLAIGVVPPLTSYDPDFLRQLFGSAPEQGTLNSTGYASADFDGAAERTASAADAATRRAAVADELRLLSDEAPMVPLFFPTGSYAYRSSTFDGWQLVRGGGILGKQSFVEPAAVPEAESQTISPSAGQDSGLSPIGIAALGVFGIALVLVAVAVVRRS